MAALQKRYTSLEKNSKMKIASLKKESDSLVSSAFVLDSELVAQKAAFLELQKENERLQDEMSRKERENLNKRGSFVLELEEKIDEVHFIKTSLVEEMELERTKVGMELDSRRERFEAELERERNNFRQEKERSLVALEEATTKLAQEKALNAKLLESVSLSEREKEDAIKRALLAKEESKTLVEEALSTQRVKYKLLMKEKLLNVQGSHQQEIEDIKSQVQDAVSANSSEILQVKEELRRESISWQEREHALRAELVAALETCEEKWATKLLDFQTEEDLARKLAHSMTVSIRDGTAASSIETEGRDVAEDDGSSFSITELLTRLKELQMTSLQTLKEELASKQADLESIETRLKEEMTCNSALHEKMIAVATKLEDRRRELVQLQAVNGQQREEIQEMMAAREQEYQEGLQVELERCNEEWAFRLRALREKQASCNAAITRLLGGPSLSTQQEGVDEHSFDLFALVQDSFTLMADELQRVTAKLSACEAELASMDGSMRELKNENNEEIELAIPKDTIESFESTEMEGRVGELKNEIESLKQCIEAHAAESALNESKYHSTLQEKDASYRTSMQDALRSMEREYQETLNGLQESHRRGIALLEEQIIALERAHHLSLWEQDEQAKRERELKFEAVKAESEHYRSDCIQKMTELEEQVLQERALKFEALKAESDHSLADAEERMIDVYNAKLCLVISRNQLENDCIRKELTETEGILQKTYGEYVDLAAHSKELESQAELLSAELMHMGEEKARLEELVSATLHREHCLEDELSDLKEISTAKNEDYEHLQKALDEVSFLCSVYADEVQVLKEDLKHKEELETLLKEAKAKESARIESFAAENEGELRAKRTLELQYSQLQLLLEEERVALSKLSHSFEELSAKEIAHKQAAEDLAVKLAASEAQLARQDQQYSLNFDDFEFKVKQHEVQEMKLREALEEKDSYVEAIREALHAEIESLKEENGGAHQQRAEDCQRLEAALALKEVDFLEREEALNAELATLTRELTHLRATELEWMKEKTIVLSSHAEIDAAVKRDFDKERAFWESTRYLFFFNRLV